MAEILLLEETSFGSVINPPYGYSRIVSPATFVLEIGAEYRVVFDGTEYSCVGVDASPLGTGAVGIGNGAAFGLAGSDEPFCVGTFSGAMIVVCLLDTEPTQHSIAIYKKEEAASGLVTENYDGTQNVFYGVETVSLENTEGEIEMFVHESLVAEPVEATVDVDWSGGDMVVTPDEGKVFSSVNIPAPENLVPENIAEGVNIAGIIGALTAGGGSNVRLASGSFRGIRTPYTVEHNLGVIPDFVISYGLMSSPNDSCLHVGTSEAGAEKLGFDKARCWRFWRYASDNYYKITSAERGYDNSASGELAISAVTETTFDVGMKDKPINKNFPQCWIALALFDPETFRIEIPSRDVDLA